MERIDDIIVPPLNPTVGGEGSGQVGVDPIQPGIFDNTGGAPGGATNATVVSNPISGDLGTLPTSLSTYLLLKESTRRLKDSVIPMAMNHRYRGHREAAKFNLAIQTILNQVVNLTQLIRAANDELQPAELKLYPTPEEAALIAHIRTQQNFKEWLLRKDVDQRWWII